MHVERNVAWGRTVSLMLGRRLGASRQYPARPMTRSGWTVSKLTELREVAADFGGDLTEIASLIGETRRRCNIALDALVGRTPEQALAVLEAAADREIQTPLSPGRRRRV
jgi:hypothetical protein